MRKFLAVAVVIFAAGGCASNEVSQISPVVKSPPFPPVVKEKQKEKKSLSEVRAFFSGVPAYYALKAACMEGKLTCDLSRLPKDGLPVNLESFKGTPQQVISLIEERAGVAHERMGDTWIFYPAQLVSLKAVDMPLGDILKLCLKKLGDYSVVIGKDVDLSREVTVLAEKRKIDDVLRQAFSSAGYEVSVNRDSKVIRIEGRVSRTVPLPSFFSNLRTADMNSSVSVYGGSSGSNTTSNIRMTFLTAVKQKFEQTLRSILKKGTISVDYDLCTVYLEGPPEEVEKAEQYINSLSKKLSKQVVIDVAVIEQSVESSKTLGIDWEAMLHAFNRKIQISQQSTGGTSGVLSIELAGTDFSAVLQAIESRGNARVITNFRLAVPNYEVQQIGRSISRTFITEVTRDVNPTTGREVYSPKSTQVSEASSLFIRPVIRSDGKIDLVIAPTISSILGVDTAAYDNVTINQPIVAQKTVPLRLIVKPGVTYVVGGIVQTSSSSSSTGVPTLSSLPVFGSVFGQATRDSKSSVIYVVLRTSILED